MWWKWEISILRGGKTIFSIVSEIIMENLEKHQIGGENMDVGRATVFPIIPGIELLYFVDECPDKGTDSHSALKDEPGTIIIQKSAVCDFGIIYRLGKHLPVSFTRYGCDMAVLINASLLRSEDMQAFQETWNFVQGMEERFHLEQQFCVVKLLPKLKEIFEELRQIPLPPTMFRFYMQLKVLEILIQLSDLNLYSKQVHFYPYQEFAE